MVGKKIMLPNTVHKTLQIIVNQKVPDNAYLHLKSVQYNTHRLHKIINVSDILYKNTDLSMVL